VPDVARRCRRAATGIMSIATRKTDVPQGEDVSATDRVLSAAMRSAEPACGSRAVSPA
jgi:hypothetical protein